MRGLGAGCAQGTLHDCIDRAASSHSETTGRRRLSSGAADGRCVLRQRLAPTDTDPSPGVAISPGVGAARLGRGRVAVDGRLDRLQALWRTVTREQVYTLRASVLFAGLLPGVLTLWALDRAGSLLDPAPLRELIATSIDLERVRASRVELRRS